jgi:hypothetical protein
MFGNHRDIQPVQINIPLIKSQIIFECSDGLRFENKVDASAHERGLRAKRLEWYNKRFSIKGELLYWLFKYEPVKPYYF